MLAKCNTCAGRYYLAVSGVVVAIQGEPCKDAVICEFMRHEDPDAFGRYLRRGVAMPWTVAGLREAARRINEAPKASKASDLCKRLRDYLLSDINHEDTPTVVSEDPARFDVWLDDGTWLRVTVSVVGEEHGKTEAR